MSRLQEDARRAVKSAMGAKRGSVAGSSSPASSGGSSSIGRESSSYPRPALPPVRASRRGAEDRSGALPEVLRLAIVEQERALEGLRRDLKVLRQIEAAWSVDEAEAARQGISAQDMALIAAFDDEDVHKVREVREKVESLLDALESEFGTQMRGYQNTIAEMEGILQTRVNVINGLESSTGIFSRYPDLAGFIASKQQKLEEALSGTHQALMDGFATSLARVKLTHGELTDLLGSGSK
jgi:hypothetical protein